MLTLVIAKAQFNFVYLNPFSASCFKLLLFEAFSAILQSNPEVLIFDIRALWRSVLMSKIKTSGLNRSMAKCKALTESAVKGLSENKSNCLPDVVAHVCQIFSRVW